MSFSLRRFADRFRRGRSGDWPEMRDFGPEPEWFGHTGIDLDVEGQRALLAELDTPENRALFAVLRNDPALNPAPTDEGAAGLDRKRDGGSDVVENPYFPSPDAELYAAMIAHSRPHRIIEVGSGYSTLVARRVVDGLDLDCELHVIDPEPRIDVHEIAQTVERSRVEESSLTADDLEPGSILFIDSSHRTTSGGDGPFLYCELLPSLAADVLVHVHDIYLPYAYPTIYEEWGYTEQYVLHALLAGSDRFSVVVAAYFLSRQHPEAMRALFGGKVAREGVLQGASFWMRSVGGG